jgi:hypothetical protein
MPAITGAALVADGRCPRRNTDRTSSIRGGPDGDREPVFAEVRRRSATTMPETTAIQPPDADILSCADIHWASCAVVARISVATEGNVPTPVGVIPARSPRVAWATSGSADIAIATPNASAKAPARPMYLANPNALVSCHV